MESRHCGLDKRIFFCPVHNASTPCSLQAFGIGCMVFPVLQSVAKSRAEFYFVQRFAHKKKLQDNPYYTVQFSSNLSRNDIARQDAKKIERCNRAFT